MVQSNNEKLNIPITLCLDGKNIIGCQNYMVNGTHLEIKTLTTVYTSFMNAGIEVHASGYKLEGCMPYSNKYCIFSANSYYPVSVVLK